MAGSSGSANGSQGIVLAVNYPAAIFVVGSRSGKKYVYIPGRDKGFLVVDDVDVEALLEKTFTNGCNCGPDSQTKRVHYFALCSKETYL